MCRRHPSSLSHVLFSVLLAASLPLSTPHTAQAAAAACDPQTMPANTPCLNKPCDPAKVGASTIDSDAVNILVCLYTNAQHTSTVWKSSTAGMSSQSGKALADTCSGTYVGGYCSGPYYKNITFPTPFDVVPNVIVSALRISDQGGDIGYATDTISINASNITNTGFTMTCSGSPVGGEPYGGWFSMGSCSWLAVSP